MNRSAHKSRVTVNAGICGGRPCIRDTRIEIAVILDGLAEGLTFEEIIDHYPQLAREDILASLAYATDLSGLSGCVAVVEPQGTRVRRPE